jgi:CTP:phosphocholine cytidylyltransferase-like protein
MMISKADIERAMEDLHEGDIEEALSILGHLLENGDFIDDMCDCDIDAKDNFELCDCGAAQFFMGLIDDEND